MKYNRKEQMRKAICKQCGKEFYEDDGNPAIHYSTPSDLCFHCEIYNEKKTGELYQDRDGNYKRKQ